MTDKELNGQRLEALHDKIVSMQERLKLKGIFHKDHKATASELLARYQLLQKELEEELVDIESHGRKVSWLEKSVLDWMNRVNFDDL